MKAKILMLLLMAAMASYADNAQIVIKQKNGGETTLALSTNPVIIFSGEDMVVTTDLTAITIPLDIIDSYVVSDETTGVGSVILEPQFLDGSVTFSNLADGTPVHVYSFDGRLIATFTSDSTSHATVNLKSLPKGTYIISAANNKIKVINK